MTRSNPQGSAVNGEAWLRGVKACRTAQLAAIVAHVQAILWKESRLLPDFPREYGEYWNPAKEWDADTLEEIADVLSDFKPPLRAGGPGRNGRTARDRR
jgi:hypothetical protein